MTTKFVSEESMVASDQREELHKRIQQLLKESSAAKEKGQWKKAQDLLLQLTKITRA
jgi:hypothetical protein